MNEENIERDKILKVGETGNWEYMKNRENKLGLSCAKLSRA